MRLEFSENGYAVSTEGVSIELLPKEYALLRFLSRNQGQAFSREQLLDRVWPREYPVERTVDDHIYRLRKSWPRSTESKSAPCGASAMS